MTGMQTDTAGDAGQELPEPLNRLNRYLRFVGETVERIDKCAKVRGLRRQGGGPYGPIELGVSFAAVQRQAVIGWLQTVLLVIVLLQVIFAGLLRALPPDLRTSLDFLHRIEWAVYLGIVLICAQVAVGWPSATVLTNRIGLAKYMLNSAALARRDPARSRRPC